MSEKKVRTNTNSAAADDELVEKLRALTRTQPEAFLRQAQPVLQRDQQISPRTRLRLLFYCAEASDYMGEPHKVQYYAEQSASVYKLLNNAEDRIYYLEHMAVFEHYRGNSQTACNYVDQALQIAKESNLNDSLLTQGLNILGVIHYQSGRYLESIECIKRHLQVIPADGTDLKACALLVNLAKNFAALGQNDTATFYFEEGINIARRLDATIVLADALNFFATHLINIRQYSRASRILQFAGSLISKHKAKRLEIIFNVLRTRIFIGKRAQIPAAALDFLQQQCYAPRQHDNVLISCLQTLTYFHLHSSNLRSARATAIRLEQLIVESGMHHFLSSTYDLLSFIEEQIGNHEKALQYFKLSTKHREKYAGPEVQRLTFMEHGDLVIWPDNKKKPFSVPTHLSANSSVSAAVPPVSRIASANRQLSQDSSQPVPEVNSTEEFKHKLLKYSPTLTPAETKVRILIKTGLQSKEIAERLHKSVETINTHRKNIRKKLDLPRNQNLSSIIAQIAARTR